MLNITLFVNRQTNKKVLLLEETTATKTNYFYTGYKNNKAFKLTNKQAKEQTIQDTFEALETANIEETLETANIEETTNLLQTKAKIIIMG